MLVGSYTQTTWAHWTPEHVEEMVTNLLNDGWEILKISERLGDRRLDLQEKDGTSSATLIIRSR